MEDELRSLGAFHFQVHDWHLSQTWTYAFGKPYTESIGIETVKQVEKFQRRKKVAVPGGSTGPVLVRSTK